MSKPKKRALYLLIFLILLAAEICIALFVHDSFVRPYVGDILVVGVVYCFVRTFLPGGVPLLPLYVFLFALSVEILQLFDIANRLGIENEVVRVIAGSVFDLKDIACYAIGCAIIAVIEITRAKGR